MTDLKISGKMNVATLQKSFLKEFGLTLRIYDGREFADSSKSLAQVRKKKGTGQELTVAKNMKVETLENKFEEEFGLKVQVAGSDDSYLCKDNLTLNAAQLADEKKLARKDRKAGRQDEASDDGEDGDLSKILNEMAECESVTDEEKSKYVFIACIDANSIYDTEHGDLIVSDADFTDKKCPKEIRKIIIDTASDLCERVSDRLDHGDPCFLILNNFSDMKSYIPINPEPVDLGLSYRVSDLIKNKNIDKLGELAAGDIIGSPNTDALITIAMVVNGCDHWDRNFLKVSEGFPSFFSIIGWHKNSEDYAIQGIDDGDYDTGIESDGGEDYLAEAYFDKFNLSKNDFDIKKYMK